MPYQMSLQRTSWNVHDTKRHHETNDQQDDQQEQPYPKPGAAVERRVHGGVLEHQRQQIGNPAALATGLPVQSFVGRVVGQRMTRHRRTCLGHRRRPTVAGVGWPCRNDRRRSDQGRWRNGGCRGARRRCGRGWRRRAARDCQDCRYSEKPAHGRLRCGSQASAFVSDEETDRGVESSCLGKIVSLHPAKRSRPRLASRSKR